MRWVILEVTLAGFLLNSFKENLSKKRIEEDHLRRVSFWGKHRFPLQKQARKSPKRPKGPKADGH